VPRRSTDPARYQRLIVSAAEYLVSTIVAGGADVDINAVLRDGYPEWFAERGTHENTRDQRLLRARGDVNYLLKTIVDRGDLAT
jgi:hypothetical protein